MKRLFKLFLSFGKISVIESLEYRSNFITSGLFSLIQAVATFILMVILMDRVSNIAGWSSYQVLLISLTFILVNAITNSLFMTGLKQFSEDLNRGNIDKYLVKPIDIQFHSIISRWDLSEIFRISGSLIAIYYVLRLLHSSEILLVTYFISVGLSCLLALLFAFSVICLVFFFGRVRNITYLVSILGDNGKVPTTVFKGAWGIILSVVIPALFIATVPVGILSGKYSWSFLLWEIILIAVFFVFARTLLKLGLKQYSGASS